MQPMRTWGAQMQQVRSCGLKLWGENCAERRLAIPKYALVNTGQRKCAKSNNVTVSIEPRLAGERKPSIAQPIEMNAIHSCDRAASAAQDGKLDRCVECHRLAAAAWPDRMGALRTCMPVPIDVASVDCGGTEHISMHQPARLLKQLFFLLSAVIPETNDEWRSFGTSWGASAKYSRPCK